MKQNKILNELFLSDELKNILQNKVIHFKHSYQNPTHMHKKEIQDVNVFDSFCVPDYIKESPHNDSTKYYLTDFYLNGFITANTERKEIGNKLIIFEEFRCEISDSDNTDKFENVVIQKYENFYHFRISNNCFGIIQKFDSLFHLEFKIIGISQTEELMKLLSFFYGIDSKNKLVIKKDNNTISLPIFLCDNIKKKISELGIIISKLIYIENDMFDKKFIIPEKISKNTIDNINLLYFVVSESELPYKHKIIMNLKDRFSFKFLNKNYVSFVSIVDTKPKLKYQIFGYQIEFKIEELLLKNAILKSSTKATHNTLCGTNYKKINLKSDKIFIHGSKFITSPKSYFSSYGSLGWHNKLVIKDDNIVFSVNTRSVNNHFDLMILSDNNKIIHNNISISSNSKDILSNIVKINGNLNLSSCGITSLGELRSIKGSFSVSSWKGKSDLTCLGKLEKISGDLLLKFSNVVNLGNLNFVGGSVDLRYTNIMSLGKLKCVHGRLNLRDTNCNDLGALEFVGEDLFLPKKFKHLIDISKLKVKGKVRYWKDIEQIITEPQKIIGLTKSKIEIPFWKHTYIYSIDNFEFENTHQKEFYNYFKRSFFNDIYIELPDNSNYIFILFFQLMKRYRKKKNNDKLKKYSEILSKFYPITKPYLKDKLVEIFDKQYNYEESWNIINNQESIRMIDVIKYDKKLKRNLLTPDLIFKLVGYSYLSDFGKKNILQVKKNIIKSLEYFEKKKNASFFTVFFRCNFKIGSEEFYEYYKDFFLRNCDYKLYKSYDIANLKRNYYPDLLHVIEKSIIHQLLQITRDAENYYREDVNIPKIGEGWIQETQLFNKIVKEFPEYEVEQHGSPDWLGRQHLDIYLPQINVAIEFQGEQHFEPVEFFGGIDGYKSTIERDIRKKNLCKKNKCELICATSDYDFKEIVQTINHAISKTK